ncbi:uncharacterized protein BROUX77_001555 [Berkeleyomyces rouxiae]|uniref:uncharacterized protein n=1 Tax=Berkeleyomyces rouxiae TaxID=2035830 RepID=UPI003B8250D7
MFFSSTAIPGGEDLENWQHYAANDKKVANRPVISPSMMMTFSQELPPNTTILSWPSFIHVVSNTAYMLASLEFSGYLDYDMDNMTVNQLYVDIDCKCETLLSMTASVHQEFQKTVDLALIRTNNIPQINIPNVISIAPVLSFAVQVNMAAKSAFVAASTYKVEIPDAKVHLDILHPGKTGLSGFTPKYYVEANATEDVAAHFNISTTLDVGLSLQIVNFVGFDCRFNLTTKVNNLVSVDGKQGIKLDDDTEMGDGPLISAPALATATAPEVTGDGKVGSNGETALGTTETVAEITSRVIDNGCGENKVRLYSEFLLDFGINNMSLFQDSKVLLNVCDDLWI